MMTGAKKVFIFIFVAVFSLQVSMGHTYAHEDEGDHADELIIAQTKLLIDGQKIALYTEVSEVITAHDTPTAEDQLDAAGQLELFERYFNYHFKIKNNGQDCPLHLDSLKQDEPDKTAYKGAFVCPNNIDKVSDLHLRSTLFSNFFDHFDHFVDIEKGPDRLRAVFNQETFEYQGTEPTATEQKPTEPVDANATNKEGPTSNVGVLAIAVTSAVATIATLAIIWFVRRVVLRKARSKRYL